MTFCEPMDFSPPGSSVHEILQARYWSELPYPPPGDLSNPGIKPTSSVSPALIGGFLTTSTTWEAQCERQFNINCAFEEIYVHPHTEFLFEPVCLKWSCKK